MKRLHVVGDTNPCNGIYVAARLMSSCEDGSSVMTCGDFLTADFSTLQNFAEIVVHGCWLPCYWKSCLKTLQLRKRLVRMTHANLDPVRLAYHGWRKCLVRPMERWLFSHSDRVLVTCPEEKDWCEHWGVKCPIEIVDLKQFFIFDEERCRQRLDEITSRTGDDPLKVMYLGREHLLKDINTLKQAVMEVNELSAMDGRGLEVELRRVCDHHDAELESDWIWADILCLPTLSENFGLVVAEALERGIPVITTDGAPVWKSQPGVIYLKNYRCASAATRVARLKSIFIALRKRQMQVC